MAKPMMPFGEWRPDVALLDNQFASDVENVLASANSYMPFPSLMPFPGAAGALPELPCLGLISARTSDGGWRIFAGTRTKLWKWSNAGWIDVSRLSGPYAVPSNGELWSMAQFGDNLVAVQSADVAQVINIDSGTNFDALAGFPPLAHKVTQLGDFLILSGLMSNRRKIIWCGVNDITQWSPGTNLCDEQEFPDGGPVQGVAGGEIGYVVQDRAIRLMQFMPGDTTFIFSFSRVVIDKGAVSEFGFTTVANVLYFRTEEGFYALQGAQLIPIGREKIDEWFLKNTDNGRANIVQAFSANRPWVVWAAHSSSAAPVYDRMVLYNWMLERWVRVTEYAQLWATLASVDLDLDTDGPEPGDDILDSDALGLDSFAYVGGRPLVCAIDVNGMLATLNGPNLQATLETSEGHLIPGMRAFVSNAYPHIDAADCVVSAGTRERLQDPIVWSAPVSLEITGSAAVYSSSRLHRFRVVIPRADVWTHGQGVTVDVQQDGTVA